ncbi:hypothetical protein ACJX0J_013147, partial [Zea mays]
FHGVPVEERLHWRSFLVKLGSKNLKGSKNEELHVASHNYPYSLFQTWISVRWTYIWGICITVSLLVYCSASFFFMCLSLDHNQFGLGYNTICS